MEAITVETVNTIDASYAIPTSSSNKSICSILKG